MNAFFNSQFSHCPLVWMSHSRSINTKINNLHFRSLRMIYNDANASFQELLFRDKSVTIHQRNLQFLAIEMFKVARGMSPDFINEVFPLNHNLNTDNISARTRLNPQFYNPSCPRKVLSGLGALRTLGPEIWNLIPDSIRKSPTLSIFKCSIKKWKPHKCPSRLCKDFIKDLGFI